jgi:hypothetical protein
MLEVRRREDRKERARKIQRRDAGYAEIAQSLRPSRETLPGKSAKLGMVADFHDSCYHISTVPVKEKLEVIEGEEVSSGGVRSTERGKWKLGTKSQILHAPSLRMGTSISLSRGLREEKMFDVRTNVLTLSISRDMLYRC